MRVWLVWTGQYSDADVVGVYSTRELAETAAYMHGSALGTKPEGWIDDVDGWEVDADAVMVRTGHSRWRIDIGVDDGSITWLYQMCPGTGEPPRVVRQRLSQLYDSPTEFVGGITPITEPERDGPKLNIECDARDKDHAVKIAGDERAKYLAVYAK